jgi:hypothetical protein
VLPLVSALDAPDAPMLRGEIFLKKEDVRLKAIDLIKSLPENGSISVRTTAEITYDGKKGFQLLLSSSGSQVWLGFDEFPIRISQSKRVLDYLNSESQRNPQSFSYLIVNASIFIYNSFSFLFFLYITILMGNDLWYFHNIIEGISKLIIAYAFWKLPKSDNFAGT